MPCARCAARAEAIIQRAFETLGGEEEQVAARERLLRLEKAFADGVAAAVVTTVLGLKLGRERI